MSNDRPLDDDDMTTGWPGDTDAADTGGGSADGIDAGTSGGPHGPRVDARVDPGTYGSRDSEGGDADAGDR